MEESRKVIELEKQNQRLREYIDTLRFALLKTGNGFSQGKKITKMSDDEEQHQILEDMIAGNVSEPTPNVLANAAVLQIIFQHLGSSELKKCRRVCKEWDRVANSKLSKWNNGNGLGVYLYVRDDEGVYPSDETVKEIKKLYSIFQAAPTDWFRVGYIHENCFARDGIRSILMDFGHRLKVIKITSYIVYVQALRSILVDWCPNLEQLGLTNIRVNSPEQHDLELILPESRLRSLKLTELSFDAEAIPYSNAPAPASKISSILLTVIKNSPNLKKLECHGVLTSIATELFSKLKHCHDIMDTLEHIFLTGSVSIDEEPLETLCKIKSMSKLKSLVLTNLKKEHRLVLMVLLNGISEHLEKLTLISCKANGDMFGDLMDGSKFAFQHMKNLQELRYLMDRQIPMESIDILATIPNLKILMLGEHSYSFEQSRSDFVDDIFYKCPKLTAKPNKKLKELYLFGSVQNPQTFEAINKIFPNLEKFVVGIGQPEPESTDIVANLQIKWIQYSKESLTKISGMKKLKNLFLHFMSIDSEYLPLSFLKSLPELEHLTISNGVMKNLRFEVVNIPKLKMLTLIGVTMDVSDAKELWLSLSKRGIFLETLKGNPGHPEDFYGIKKDSQILF